MKPLLPNSYDKRKFRVSAGMSADQAAIPFHWIASALVANALAVLALMLRNDLTVDVSNWGFVVLAGIVVALSSIRLAMHNSTTLNQVRCRDFSESCLALILICLLGAIGSYEAATDSSGFYDATLEHTDQLLHFDWLTIYTVVSGHPVLQHLGAIAYDSVFLSPIILIGWLAWHGRRAQAHRFLAAFWLSSVLTLLIFPLFPARGPLEFLWHGPIRYMPTNGLYQAEIIPALRDHMIRHIELGSIRGLVCAPSFHTVCAVIYIVAAWPFAALRRILVPLNIAMLLAIPVEGTHYLVDMILGAMVGTTSMLLVRGAVMLTGGRRLAIRELGTA